MNLKSLLGVASVWLGLSTLACGDAYEERIASALERTGDNLNEVRAALSGVNESRSEGMRFLIAHMPDRDLRQLSADFLIENVDYAYQAWEQSPWRARVPKEIFLNDVLPYASINESRDRWRKEFYERFQPFVGQLKEPGKAAATLNQKIFPELNVKYSTKRRRADQGPLESIESGLASCTGLSILLIDACRSVGIPARFVGTPLWSDRSGNHSWVEVWDDGWHFTGAAEPAGDQLDKAWFVGRASGAQRDHRRHAIYAVSFRQTPINFPLVWDRSIDYVHAVNVTDRYANQAQPLPKGHKYAMFRVLGADGVRCCAALKVVDQHGEVVFEGETKDERFDANDHISTALKRNETYSVQLKNEDGEVQESIRFTDDDDGDRELFTFELGESAEALAALRQYLDDQANDRSMLGDQEFANVPLTKRDSEKAYELLTADHRRILLVDRKPEMEQRLIKVGEHEMPFFYKVYGDRPARGRSMYISMHGGGGAPKRVNDRQWENQKRLYKPSEGVYVAPRAPTDTWNLWHQGHIDALFDRLIENMIAFEDVDPNRVYLMGYSAGGDGVYQLAPRMADRWAAAAMMAGHPNEASPLGLRNIGFAIYVGGRDGAYSRNKVAADWQAKLADLKEKDENGYQHLVTIYPDKGHWMDGADASALLWMYRFTRNPHPNRVVWKQDDVTQSRFYWLAVRGDNERSGSKFVAELDGQKILLAGDDLKRVLIRMNDDMIDLDQPVTVMSAERTLFAGTITRTIATQNKTLNERGDPTAVYSSELAIELP